MARLVQVQDRLINPDNITHVYESDMFDSNWLVVGKKVFVHFGIDQFINFDNLTMKEFLEIVEKRVYR